MIAPIAGGWYSAWGAFSYSARAGQGNPVHLARQAPPQSPVTPAAPVSPVRAEQTSAAPAGPTAVREGGRLPFLREGVDPAEMAVRMRIQYPEDLQGPAADMEAAQSPQEVMEEAECQTCKDRKYQDGSDDPGVSFKTPGKIAPEVAASVVRAHEMEHVTREQAKAEREGRKVVSQSVTLHTDICPECGKVYVSGGTTRTTTKADNRAELFQQYQQETGQAGTGFEAVA